MKVRILKTGADDWKVETLQGVQLATFYRVGPGDHGNIRPNARRNYEYYIRSNRSITVDGDNCYFDHADGTLANVSAALKSQASRVEWCSGGCGQLTERGTCDKCTAYDEKVQAVVSASESVRTGEQTLRVDGADFRTFWKSEIDGTVQYFEASTSLPLGSVTASWSGTFSGYAANSGDYIGPLKTADGVLRSLVRKFLARRAEASAPIAEYRAGDEIDFGFSRVSAENVRASADAESAAIRSESEDIYERTNASAPRFALRRARKPTCKRSALRFADYR